MTIEEYISKNNEFDILSEFQLEFSNPDCEKEAVENIRWVFDNEPCYEALCVVVRSYYSGVLNW